MIDLAGVCTGDGPCVSTPVGTGRNWVNKAGGDSAYIHAIVHALQRAGHSEQDAERLAHGIIEHWAKGGGNVTAATRARAASALAHWEAIRAKAHASHDHTAARRTLIDLAGGAPMALTVNTLTKPQVIALAKRAEKMPEPGRSKLKAQIRTRALALHMPPDGDGDFDYDVPAKADMSADPYLTVDLAVLVAARKAAKAKGATLPGTMKYPTENEAQFKKAIKMVGLVKGQSSSTVKAYLKARGKKMGWAVPADW